jgi:Domain of unknown function (DUF4276)
MTHLVFLLEEPSAKDLLEGLLPKLLPATIYPYYLVFEGKQDLEAQLVRKLKGWQKRDSAFVVLRDQDAADCRKVKKGLSDLVAQSGRSPSLIRVACKELEAWVVGDWCAIAEAFERPELEAQGQKAAHRTPDALVRPIEAIQRHVPEYQKRDGARRLGPLLYPERNQSESFRAFCGGIKALVEKIAANRAESP